MVAYVIVVIMLSSLSYLTAQNLNKLRNSESIPAAPPTSDSKFSQSDHQRNLYQSLIAASKLDLHDPKITFSSPNIWCFDSPSAFPPSNIENSLAVISLGDRFDYLKIIASSEGTVPYQISGAGLKTGLARISALYRASSGSEALKDCSPIALSFGKRIKANPANALELIAGELAIHPSCACEIVKSALIATEADTAFVVAIVETAINASPENARIISQCAIAIAPEAINAIQALLAKLYPDSPEEASSSKSSKSSKDSKDSIDGKYLKNDKLGKASFAISEIDIPRIPMNIPPIVFPPVITEVNPVTLPTSSPP